jgi:hypothetical protein
MSDFIKNMNNNKKWVEQALATDPNFFADF